MSKPRILLISSQHLFGESMETILRAEKDMELIGPWNLHEKEICHRVLDVHPSVVVIADENLQSEAAAELTRSILEEYSELSVIRTALNENVFRIFSTHTLPARGADLLDTIRGCMVRTQEVNRSDNPKKYSGGCETHE
jgi:DNA-binding NarL/FixJ family response regulator